MLEQVVLWETQKYEPDLQVWGVNWSSGMSWSDCSKLGMGPDPTPGQDHSSYSNSYLWTWNSVQAPEEKQNQDC